MDLRRAYALFDGRVASAEELKRRYWKLCAQWHPDRCRHPQALERMSEINAAYLLLTEKLENKGVPKRSSIPTESVPRRHKATQRTKSAGFQRADGMHRPAAKGVSETAAAIRELGAILFGEETVKDAEKAVLNVKTGMDQIWDLVGGRDSSKKR